MSHRDSTLHLNYILESIEVIVQYVEGNNKQLFLTDGKTYDAVLRRLHTLAESTMHLSPEIKQSIPGIEWEMIAGFRHVLVHEYLGTVNNERVWAIIVERLPELKRVLQNYRSNHDGH